MKKPFALFAITAALVSLTACSSDHIGSETTNDVVEGRWLHTNEGDVYCLMETTSMGYEVTDCNWSTLREATGTINQDELTETGWVNTDQGKVLCIYSMTRMGYEVTDCNWDTLVIK